MSAALGMIPDTSRSHYFLASELCGFAIRLSLRVEQGSFLTCSIVLYTCCLASELYGIASRLSLGSITSRFAVLFVYAPGVWPSAEESSLWFCQHSESLY